MILILRNYLRNCLLIPKQLSKCTKLKNQTKKRPLKIQKPKISLKSLNIRKQTHPLIPVLFLRVFGLFLLSGTSKYDMDFTALLATPRPLDRHPTCHTFEELFFYPPKGVIDILRSKRGCPNVIRKYSSFLYMIIHILRQKK